MVQSVKHTTPYRDSSGRGLDAYPRPSVAVDVAVLTVPPGPDASLSVVTIDGGGERRHDRPRLPGTFLHPGELLVDAALRALSEKAGLRGVRPCQVHVFDAEGRDDRGWVLSVAHLDVVPYAAVESALEAGARLRPVAEVVGLAFDHDAIVAYAVDRVRQEHVDRPDPYAMLDEPFTLLELQRLHESVAGTQVVKDTFRRRMQPYLQQTNELRDGVVGKPARLWRRGSNSRE